MKPGMLRYTTFQYYIETMFSNAFGVCILVPKLSTLYSGEWPFWHKQNLEITRNFYDQKTGNLSYYDTIILHLNAIGIFWYWIIKRHICIPWGYQNCYYCLCYYEKYGIQHTYWSIPLQHSEFSFQYHDQHNKQNCTCTCYLKKHD